MPLFNLTFDSPFFGGTASSVLVPHKFDVAIAGRGYMLDRDYMAQTPLISSIRATRTQGDGSTEMGEQSLNPEDLWRRSQQSWHFGAGQTYLDRDDSNRRRFNASKGIDPWTEGELSLLNTTTRALNTSSTNLHLVVAGSRLYVADGAALKWTDSLSSWNTVTGTSGVAITSLATDGKTIWIADGTDIYKTTSTTTTASKFASNVGADILGFVKNRLVYSENDKLHQVTNFSSAATASILDHANDDITWIGFAEAPGHIMCGATLDKKAYIYKITLTAEGTNLGAPSVAGELPDGETLFAIGSYLGFIVLGTSKGARFCTVDSNGNLTIGAIIPTPEAVRCFEGQDEFIWYGLTNYEGTSGLGRMSLRTFSDPQALKPAYASDIYVNTSILSEYSVAATAATLSVVTYDNKRVFSVSGSGVWAEDTASLVPSGTIDCGRFNFGITERKIPVFLDVTFASGFAGSVSMHVAKDGSGVFDAVGTQTTSSPNLTAASFEMKTGSVDQAEMRFTLNRGSTVTQGPTLIRYTVRAQPVPTLRRRLVLPLLLSEKVQTRGKTLVTYDLGEELNTIEGWLASRQILTVQIGHESYQSALEDFDFVALHPTVANGDNSFWNGTCILQFKTI